jgi:hypothetical protein
MWNVLIIIAVVLIIIPQILRKQWCQLIGTLLMGIIAIYFVNNPDMIIRGCGGLPLATP